VFLGPKQLPAGTLDKNKSKIVEAIPSAKYENAANTRHTMRTNLRPALSLHLP